MSCTLKCDKGRVEMQPYCIYHNVRGRWPYAAKVTFTPKQSARVRAEDYRSSPNTFTVFQSKLFLYDHNKPMRIPCDLCRLDLENFRSIVFNVSTTDKRQVRVKITGIKGDGSSVQIFNKRVGGA